MQVEYDRCVKNDIFSLVERPKGANVIPLRWVCKVKRDGTVRCRLAALGYRQREGIDYGSIFAPVTNATSTNVIVDLAVSADRHLYQADIPSAFYRQTTPRRGTLL